MFWKSLLTAWLSFVVIFILINGYLILMKELKAMDVTEYLSIILWIIPISVIIYLISAYIEKRGK